MIAIKAGIQARIAAYILFIASLFVIDDARVLLVCGLVVSWGLVRHSSRRRLMAGIVPVTFLLFAVFAGNLFFHPGRIVAVIGGVEITGEGLHVALVRTVRLLVMVLSTKLLAATTRPDELVCGLGMFLRPLKACKVPVDDFIEIVVLSLYAFPRLMDALKERFNAHVAEQGVTGFRKKFFLAVSLPVPLLVAIIESPESVFAGFERVEGEDKKNKAC